MKDIAQGKQSSAETTEDLPHLSFEFCDSSVIEEAESLIKFAVENRKNFDGTRQYEIDASKMEQFFSQFLRKFFATAPSSNVESDVHDDGKRNKRRKAVSQNNNNNNNNNNNVEETEVKPVTVQNDKVEERSCQVFYGNKVREKESEREKYFA